MNQKLLNYAKLHSVFLFFWGGGGQFLFPSLLYCETGEKQAMAHPDLWKKCIYSF